jgi:hypothetical protein
MPQDSDPSTTPQRSYIRFDLDLSDEELEAAAMEWVESILGPPEIEDDPDYPRPES